MITIGPAKILRKFLSWRRRLEKGTSICSLYMHSQLNRAYGSVYKGIHKSTGYVVAIKTLPAGDTPEDIEKEIGILKKARDPNIVSYYGCCIKDHTLWVNIHIL